MSENDPNHAAARADFCRFLAACYYEPGTEFAEEKLFDSMAAAGRLIDAEFEARARRLGEAFAAARLEELLIDYTRLFLGPIDAPAKPYGSVWLGTEKELMQDSTMAVLQLYEEGGFDIAEDFRELPDHVAAELEFLYLLLFREDQATRGGDVAAQAATTKLRKRLLGEHLRRWIGPFTDAMLAAAQTAFYRELAGLTGRFVGMESCRAAAQS